MITNIFLIFKTKYHTKSRKLIFSKIKLLSRNFFYLILISLQSDDRLRFKTRKVMYWVKSWEYRGLGSSSCFKSNKFAMTTDEGLTGMNYRTIFFSLSSVRSKFMAYWSPFTAFTDVNHILRTIENRSPSFLVL